MLDDLVVHFDGPGSDIVLQLDSQSDLELVFDRPATIPISDETYMGPYVVEPVFYEDQHLATANRHMLSDVTVRQIKVVESTNPSGGKTVVIG